MKKVLIVEDDVDILEAIQLTLQVDGYDVRAATHGDEGLDLASSYQPDLIILDYFLAGSNGATICKILKQSSATKHIPVMMTSAHPSAQKVVIDHGADSFIAKPFSISEFMDKVAQSMRSSPIVKNSGGNGCHCS